MSFAKLMQRFKGGVCTDDRPAQQQDPLRLATAAVLLDIGYADGTLSREEDEDLVTYLKRTFALDDTMAQELVKAAAEIRAQTIDHFALTHFIRRNATLTDRIEIVSYPGPDPSIRIEALRSGRIVARSSAAESAS